MLDGPECERAPWAPLLARTIKYANRFAYDFLSDSVSWDNCYPMAQSPSFLRTSVASTAVSIVNSVPLDLVYLQCHIGTRRSPATTTG